MGLLKHSLTKRQRSQIVDYFDRNLPEGFIRNNFANFETLGGLGLVAAGAAIDGKTGLALRAIGEAVDDIDGDTARALGIDSRLGALLDPVTDKLKMLIELGVLWKHTRSFEQNEKDLRRAALLIIAGKHTVNATLNSTAFVLGQNPKSSNMGRLNLWIDGVAVEAFGLSDVVEDTEMSQKIANIGYTAVAIGVPTGIITSFGYTRDLLNPLPTGA